jgi:cell division protein FtsQ
MRALGFQLVRAAPVRRDPAPTRWQYRWQRWMLRPLFRRIVRVGLPVALCSTAVGLWAFSPANRAAISATVADLRAGIENRPEFMVGSVAITGADQALTRAITGLTPVSFPVSSFQLDLEALHSDIAALSAVQQATVAIRPGGILTIDVTERVPVAVWRHTDGLRLIDADGVLTGMILDRADRADLPLIAGDGAIDVIAEALALFRTAAPVADRVRGLVRMGKRRWDLILDGEVRVLLPEENPGAALDHVLALHLSQGLFDRDIVAVDLRNPHRATVRLTSTAAGAIRNMTDISTEGAGN